MRASCLVVVVAIAVCKGRKGKEACRSKREQKSVRT